jgi:hypothetical protein
MAGGRACLDRLSRALTVVGTGLPDTDCRRWREYPRHLRT